MDNEEVLTPGSQVGRYFGGLLTALAWLSLAYVLGLTLGIW